MKLLFVLNLLFVTSTFAGPDCHPRITLPELRELVEGVRDAYFPALDDRDLPFQNYDSEEYFFQASVNISELLRGRKKFCLDVNERLLNCPPSKAALTSIIVHELFHFHDYQSLPLLGVSKLGIRYAASKKFRRNYERQTDLRTLELGHGPGLSEYREWLYEMLPPKAVKTKKYYYLTPEEILSADNP